MIPPVVLIALLVVAVDVKPLSDSMPTAAPAVVPAGPASTALPSERPENLSGKQLPDPGASAASMQVLEIASKNVDIASGLVSLAGYILAALGIVLAIVTVVIQIVGVSMRNRAVQKAIERTLKGLSTNKEFAEQVLQEIIQKEQIKTYVFTQIDAAVQLSAAELLSKEYFEAKKKELDVNWENTTKNSQQS